MIVPVLASQLVPATTPTSTSCRRAGNQVVAAAPVPVARGLQARCCWRARAVARSEQGLGVWEVPLQQVRFLSHHSR